MPKHLRLIVEVWREACRHIEIDRSTTAIAERLVTALRWGG